MTKYTAESLKLVWNSNFKLPRDVEEMNDRDRERRAAEMNALYAKGKEAVNNLIAEEQTKPDWCKTMKSPDDCYGKERLTNYLTKNGVKSEAGTLGNLHTEKIIDDLIKSYLDNSDD